MKPVIFSSELSPSERRIYKAATILFVVIFFAFMWPIYPIFNHVRPLILGMPLSLLYLVFLLSVAFGAILTLYLWEDRHGKLQDPPEPARDRRPPSGDQESGLGSPDARRE